MIVLLHADGSIASIRKFGFRRGAACYALEFTDRLIVYLLVGYQDGQTLAATIEALLAEP